MKDTKAVFKFFSIFQWEQEQDYLRRQHQNGWRFVRVNSICIYYFERCEPEDMVYQLDYNPDGLAHKQEYVQMFRDCGWEYLQDFVGYSYFRKPASQMDGDEEIFCDDSSRLDMMGRVLKGRLLPLVIIFFCIIVPQLVLQTTLDGVLSDILLGVFAVLGVLYLILFLVFGVQFWKCWKSLKK